MQSIKQTIRQNPIGQTRWLKAAYWKTLGKFRRIGLVAPVSPTEAGIAAYRKTSSWPLDTKSCPCDLQLVEYLQTRNIHNQSIFHFGTGSHHIVGLENQKLTNPNEILAITASRPEHDAYIQLVLQNRGLDRAYKVLFCDIYTLSERSLPEFDLVTLFHLCEFSLPDQSAFTNHDDASLLDLFLQKLQPKGRIIFYDRSNTWPETQELIGKAIAQGKIAYIETHKNLHIYMRK